MGNLNSPPIRLHLILTLGRIYPTKIRFSIEDDGFFIREDATALRLRLYPLSWSQGRYLHGEYLECLQTLPMTGISYALLLHNELLHQ